LKALALSAIQDGPANLQAEKQIDANPYDPSASANPQRKCLVLNKDDANEAGSAAIAGMDIPKTDLMAELPPDILSKMVCRFVFVIYIAFFK
jgi:hypothetical protein